MHSSQPSYSQVDSHHRQPTTCPLPHLYPDPDQDALYSYPDQDQDALYSYPDPNQKAPFLYQDEQTQTQTRRPCTHTQARSEGAHLIPWREMPVISRQIGLRHDRTSFDKKKSKKKMAQANTRLSSLELEQSEKFLDLGTRT